MKYFLPLIVAILFILPNTSVAKKPYWLSGMSKKYSEPQYYIGVGESRLGRGSEKQVRSLAGDRARAEIAKTLRSNVDVFSRAERTVSAEAVYKKKVVPVARSTQSETIVVTSTELLEDVEVKEYYEDKKSQTLFALAVLDRVKAAKRLEGKVAVVKSELLQELGIGEELKNKSAYLPAIGHYNKALSLAAEVNRANELISVLKPVGPSPLAEGVSTEADIRNILTGIKEKVRFTQKVDGPAAGVAPYLTRALLGAGFLSSGAAKEGTKSYDLIGKTDLTYKGTIEMSEKLQPHIYQADIDLEVYDPTDKSVVGVITLSASANEKTEELAKKSAVRALGRLIESDFAKEISSF